MQDKFQLEPDDGVGLAIASLRELAKAENECTRCPLYKHATQAVPGEGRKGAHLMSPYPWHLPPALKLRKQGRNVAIP